MLIFNMFFSLRRFCCVKNYLNDQLILNVTQKIKLTMYTVIPLNHIFKVKLL